MIRSIEAAIRVAAVAPEWTTGAVGGRYRCAGATGCSPTGRSLPKRWPTACPTASGLPATTAERGWGSSASGWRGSVHSGFHDGSGGRFPNSTCGRTSSETAHAGSTSTTWTRTIGSRWRSPVGSAVYRTTARRCGSRPPGGRRSEAVGHTPAFPVARFHAGYRLTDELRAVEPGAGNTSSSRTTGSSPATTRDGSGPGRSPTRPGGSCRPNSRSARTRCSTRTGSIGPTANRPSTGSVRSTSRRGGSNGSARSPRARSPTRRPRCAGIRASRCRRARGPRRRPRGARSVG